MKCEVCKRNISINYGNAYTIICKECIEKDAGHQALIKDKKYPIEMENGTNVDSIMKIYKLVQVLGMISCVVGVLCLIVGIALNNLFNFLIGIIIITLGAGTYALGSLIPYIVSIEKNISSMQNGFKGANSISEEDKKL